MSPTATPPSWILYGANGYTGTLFAHEAVRRGLKPILAGRSAEKIRPIAEHLGLEYKVFGLHSPVELDCQLQGQKLILLAAGPFSRTSKPVVDACLRTGTSYLDITGEVAVFEKIFSHHQEAVAAGCVLLPGVGFDVVPSDCLAASLKAQLPEADTLELAFAISEGPSAGTAKTILQGIPQGGAVRRNGKLELVPAAWKTATIPFRDRARLAVTIPWGDLSAAYRSTGIPNITTSMAAPLRTIRMMRLLSAIGGLIGLRPVQKILSKLIEAQVRGPDEDSRKRGRSQLWGRVSAPNGETVEGTLEIPESYEFTAIAGIEIASRLLKGDPRPGKGTSPDDDRVAAGGAAGAMTPSMAFGPSFITELEGCDLRIGPRRPKA